MFSILEVTEAITSKLRERVENIPFRWKSSEDPTTYKEVTPTVEAFTFDDTNEAGYPLHTPSILIQPVTESGGVWHFIIFVCCVHPAIQEQEKTVKDGETGNYVYKEGDKFTSLGCRKELLKFGLLLSEQVSRMIQSIANDNQSLRITNISLNAPSPTLPEFPYTTATLEFDCVLSQVVNRINTDLAKLL